jgi:flagellar hook-associated protein 1 FlgK
VRFAPPVGFGAPTSGNPVYVDGVPLSPASGGNTDASGKIAGLLQLRDDVAVKMQSQLDEISRGLISTFAETDPSGVADDAPGLFTWPGAPTMPADSTVMPGLAGRIAINSALDSSAGGNPELLRDGGINGAAYVHNISAASGYADLLIGYGNLLDKPMTFDADAGITTLSSLNNYASASVGWFEGLRQQASTAADSKQALASRTGEALSYATGVNMDTELSLLLDLEHSYQASARLMATVGQMLDSLLQAVG